MYTVIHDVGSGEFRAYKDGIGAERVKYRPCLVDKTVEDEVIAGAEPNAAVNGDEQAVTAPAKDSVSEPPVAEVTCRTTAQCIIDTDSKITLPDHESKAGSAATKSVHSRRSERGEDSRTDKIVQSCSDRLQKTSAGEATRKICNSSEPNLTNNDGESLGLRRLASMASPTSDATSPAKNAKIANETKQYPRFEIPLPLWLQKDASS